MLRELHSQSTQQVYGLARAKMGEFVDYTTRSFTQPLRPEDLDSHKRHLQIMTEYAREIGGETWKEFNDHRYVINIFDPGYEALTSNTVINDETMINYVNSLSKVACEKFSEKILENYQKELSQCTSNDQKIKCIADMVQQLERLHPFPDANCRTFCMMLLNLELVKNDLSPTLQDNPNDFDFLSLESLTMKIKEGQERFQSCIKDNGNLAGVEYNDLQGYPSPVSPDWIDDLSSTLQLLNESAILNEPATVIEEQPSRLEQYEGSDSEILAAFLAAEEEEAMISKYFAEQDAQKQQAEASPSELSEEVDIDVDAQIDDLTEYPVETMPILFQGI